MLRLRHDDVVWRKVEGDVVVLNVRQSEYFGLNPSGALLWQRLNEGSSREALIAALQERYGIERTRAAEDVDSFLELLRSHDVLMTQ